VTGAGWVSDGTPDNVIVGCTAGAYCLAGAGTLRAIVDDSRRMKKAGRGPARGRKPNLEGRVLAMIFDRPSTRTRVSFDVAMRQLGGDAIMLTGAEMQLGRGETIADTARVLSRFVDAIMIRTLDHATVVELAKHATVPVINGLTRQSHPCQVMADLLTFEEFRRMPEVTEILERINKLRTE